MRASIESWIGAAETLGDVCRCSSSSSFLSVLVSFFFLFFFWGGGGGVGGRGKETLPDYL